jgi:hypothetical protein
VKSPISIRNRRFNTSKLQKMGVLYSILSKALAHFPNFPKKTIIIKNFKKMGPA